MMTVEHAYYFIDDYYNRILNPLSSTGSRRYSYSRIVEKYYDCPQMQEYWEINSSATYYENRVKKLKDFPTRKNVEEMDWFDWYPENNPCAYIVYLPDCEMLKVGKAKVFHKRITSLKQSYGTVIPLHLFTFEDEEDAYQMEILLHKYFKKMYPYSFVPQDRFECAVCTKEDIEILDKAADKLRKINWF